MAHLRYRGFGLGDRNPFAEFRHVLEVLIALGLETRGTVPRLAHGALIRLGGAPDDRAARAAMLMRHPCTRASHVQLAQPIR